MPQSGLGGATEDRSATPAASEQLSMGVTTKTEGTSAPARKIKLKLKPTLGQAAAVGRPAGPAGGAAGQVASPPQAGGSGALPTIRLRIGGGNAGAGGGGAGAGAGPAGAAPAAAAPPAADQPAAPAPAAIVAPPGFGESDEEVRLALELGLLSARVPDACCHNAPPWAPEGGAALLLRAHYSVTMRRPSAAITQSAGSPLDAMPDLLPAVAQPTSQDFFRELANLEPREPLSPRNLDAIIPDRAAAARHDATAVLLEAQQPQQPQQAQQPQHAQQAQQAQQASQQAQWGQALPPRPMPPQF